MWKFRLSTFSFCLLFVCWWFLDLSLIVLHPLIFFPKWKLILKDLYFFPQILSLFPQTFPSFDPLVFFPFQFLPVNRYFCIAHPHSSKLNLVFLIWEYYFLFIAFSTFVAIFHIFPPNFCSSMPTLYFLLRNCFFLAHLVFFVPKFLSPTFWIFITKSNFSILTPVFPFLIFSFPHSILSIFDEFFSIIILLV